MRARVSVVVAVENVASKADGGEESAAKKGEPRLKKAARSGDGGQGKKEESLDRRT